MKKIPILSSVTLPWPDRFSRRHTPPPAQGENGYREYRACLRWEFGFSCVFCLCHEADFMLAGTEGWGVMQVEHFNPKSVDAGGRNDYANCFYICGRCNRAHGNAPIQDPLGRKLLNPSEDAWGDFWGLVENKMFPLDQQNHDAAYTDESYRLNDRYKVKLRALRKEVIEDRVSFLKQSSRYLDKIFDRIAAGGDEVEIEMARELSRRRRAAVKDLLRYRAVPLDHDTSCRCGNTAQHSLPINLESQTFDLIGLLSRRGGSRATPNLGSQT